MAISSILDTFFGHALMRYRTRRCSYYRSRIARSRRSRFLFSVADDLRDALSEWNKGVYSLGVDGQGNDVEGAAQRAV